MSREAAVAEPSRVNRDNYMHMSGDTLRDYAHTLGMSRSEAARLDDTQLKHQCRLLISRIYEDAP